MEDYYKLLGVDRYASAKEIEDAFNENKLEQQAIMKAAEGTFLEEKAALRLQALFKAKKILSDPMLRSAYDREMVGQNNYDVIAKDNDDLTDSYEGKDEDERIESRTATIRKQKMSVDNNKFVYWTPDMANTDGNEDDMDVIIGKGNHNNYVELKLKSCLNVLIAGNANSGKSECVKTIIASLLLRNTPNDLRLLLVDTKDNELCVFDEVPHMISPTIVDRFKINTAIKWLVNESQKRLEMFSKQGCCNIEEYNSSTDLPMPYVLLVIDDIENIQCDISDLEQVLNDTINTGIVTILTVRVPYAKLIGPSLKNNLFTRIAFTMSSYSNSRMIINSGGAEKLFGSGDMYYRPAKKELAINVQGVYISPEYLRQIIDTIKTYDYNYENEEDKVDELDNSLFLDALYILYETNFVSADTLQKKLGIDNSVANKVIGWLAEEGFISGYGGCTTKRALKSKEEMEDYLAHSNIHHKKIADKENLDVQSLYDMWEQEVKEIENRNRRIKTLEDMLPDSSITDVDTSNMSVEELNRINEKRLELLEKQYLKKLELQAKQEEREYKRRLKEEEREYKRQQAEEEREYKRRLKEEEREYKRQQAEEARLRKEREAMLREATRLAISSTVQRGLFGMLKKSF